MMCHSLNLHGEGDVSSQRELQDRLIDYLI